MASRKRTNLTNTFSRSIESFFSVSNEMSGWSRSSSEEAKGSRSWWWSGKWDKKNYSLFLLHTFWLYCLLYYWRFPLLCIKRDAPCQLQINCHFHFLNFPTVSSLLHIREILVHWPFLEISGPQKWVVGATLALKQKFLAGTLITWLYYQVKCTTHCSDIYFLKLSSCQFWLQAQVHNEKAL